MRSVISANGTLLFSVLLFELVLTLFIFGRYLLQYQVEVYSGVCRAMPEVQSGVIQKL
ncbi:hypothetical protein Galf_2571 [Gallionella capsiferriformans ES-2]|uniref:Uncharacterized protein n=1 Tax=Gallionella capsiferriformans (strain ES-2) TaxID=395494 RepID=D9SCI9_GALCS|nr:hypothetical protein Galf_2571 [Gallionella capsiferriformans ES-2]